MHIRRPRWAMILALTTLLAGCGTVPGLNARVSTPSKVSARSLSQDEIWAKLQASNMVTPMLIAGLPAILSAPTDFTAQQYMLNAKAKGIPQSLASVETTVDDSMAEGTIRDFEQQYAPLPATDPLVVYLQGVADRLTKASGMEPFTVHVVDCPYVNAFNAGGHSMVIFKGFLAAAEDEAELACVMAHEMTHGDKRHVIQGTLSNMADIDARAELAKRLPVPKAEEDLVQAYFLTLPLEQMATPDAFLSFLQGKVGPDTMTRVRFQMNCFITSYAGSREHEAEADKFGARMAARAGYDPNGMVRFFDRLNQYPDGDTRFYDHPALGARIGAVRYQIQQEGLAEKGTDRGADRYAAIKAKFGKMAVAQGKAKAPSSVPTYLSRNFCF